MRSHAARPFETVELSALEHATGGFEEQLHAEGYRLDRWQGDIREYCRTPPHAPSARQCVAGVVQGGQWRQGVGAGDYERNRGQQIFRAVPVEGWGAPR